MTGSTTDSTFRRTLPLFDNEDRDVVQRLLHHAVADFEYDHPDRKIARDLYHDVREGDAVRLHVGWNLEDLVLVISPQHADATGAAVVERFVEEMRARPGEWAAVASDLAEWRGDAGLSEDPGVDVDIGFEYLH